MLRKMLYLLLKFFMFSYVHRNLILALKVSAWRSFSKPPLTMEAKLAPPILIIFCNICHSFVALTMLCSYFGYVFCICSLFKITRAVIFCFCVIQFCNYYHLEGAGYSRCSINIS